MKRDIDLCRQLLFDLEAKGPDCALNALRGGLAVETDVRLRFHLRLLVDAGLVKETHRTTSHGTYLRLTNAGVELIELCRSDARWREAKAVVLDRTGGQSLTAIRTVLTKWAVESSTYTYTRLPRRTVHPYYRRDLVKANDELRLLRTTPDYRERLQWSDRWYDGDYDYDYHVSPMESEATEPSVQLPIYLV